MLISMLMVVVLGLEINITVHAKAIDLPTFNSKLEQFKKDVYSEGSTYKDNSSYGGYECFGFANQIAQYMFGSFPTSSGSAISNVNANWKITYGGAAINNLVIGDIVRFAWGSYDHSIFITNISGDNVYYCQANVPANTNRVTYSNNKDVNVITKTNLANYVSKKLNGNSAKTGWVAHYKDSILGTESVPQLMIKFDANGGNIESNIVSNTFKVTESIGINMRSGAGTSYSVLKSLPKGTTFTVNVGETKVANNYTWGKTTYSGKTGWVVVSDYVELIKVNRNTDYYLSSSIVYKSDTASLFTQIMKYGETSNITLYSASTFGLEKKGYKFVGWCSKADGSAPVYAPNVFSGKAEDIYTVNNGSATIVLYAIWECDHVYSNVCDVNCNRCGENRKAPHEYVNKTESNLIYDQCKHCGDKTNIKVNELLNGWIKDNNNWLYYEKGVKVTNAWIKDSVSWCYLGSDGYAYTNRWAKDSKGWCWLGSDSRMVTSRWIKDTKGWCYIGADGYAYMNRWAKDSQGWCWLGSNNYMVTSCWVKDTKGWCYIGADGHAYSNRWVKDSKGWCYVGSDNYIVTNTYVYDSIGKCWINSSGYWDGKYI